MWRNLWVAGLLCCAILRAANFKLYLKDGSYQVVREYKVDGDRVGYYSIERSDWEEIPLTLVDVAKTEGENASRRKTLDKQTKDLDEEEAAAKEIRAQIRKIPQDPGVYMLGDKGELRMFKAAESTLHSNKGRTILKTIVGLPMIPGKATVEIPGEHAEAVVADSRPEFYLQLSRQDRYAIVKLSIGKGVRVVEDVSTIPVSKESVEERREIEIFTKQLTDNMLFKIWPQEPMPKGEYAVIEFVEGKVNAQIWDFRIE